MTDDTSDVRGVGARPIAYDHDLGVLFVHGIGRQRRGDTVRGWCDAIAAWSGLCDRVGTVDVNVTAADLQAEGAPPHAALRVRVNGEGADWLAAEAFWADSFATPTFGELARWSVEIVPWTLATHAIRAARRAVDRQSVAPRWTHREISGQDWVEEATHPWAWKGWLAFRAAVWRVVVLLLGLVGAPLLAAFLFVTTLLAVVPITWVRSFVRSLQRGLAATIGDSMVLLSSPAQAAAITSIVRRDAAWLAERCARVVIVAHSQGAAIAVEAVAPGAVLSGATGGSDATDPRGSVPGVTTFVSLGSGVNKLATLADLRLLSQRRLGWAISAAALLFALASGLLVREILVGRLAVRDVAEPLAILAAMLPWAFHSWGLFAKARWSVPRLSRRELQGLLDLLSPEGTSPRSRLSDRTLRSLALSPVSRRSDEDVAAARVGRLLLAVHTILPVANFVGVLWFISRFEQSTFARIGGAPPLFFVAVLLLMSALIVTWLLYLDLPHHVGPRLPAPMGRWVDLYASADPVANGPTPSARPVRLCIDDQWVDPKLFFVLVEHAAWLPRSQFEEAADEVSRLREQVRTTGDRRARARLVRLLRPNIRVERLAVPDEPRDTGDARAASTANPVDPNSVMVHNSGSLLFDHTGYQRSHDGAMLRLMIVLCDQVGTPLRVTGDRLQDGFVRRRRRVAALQTGRAIVAIATIGVVLALRSSHRLLGRAVMERYEAVIARLPLGLDETLAVDVGGRGMDVIGVVLLVVGGLAVHWAIGAVWAVWDRRAAARWL